ncbi:PP2C family protein-serine/threonine phosphatase [Solibacillus silvestris]|uniref:PP2C family protein-serine/threonine phosphatase n=1 Tax=Solibacillus silvestris TaxID=76853 RepID=UPI003F80C45C
MKELQIQYQKILSDFLTNETERNLYIGQNFIRQLIQKKVAPEEVINIHKYAIEQIYPDLSEHILKSYDFLIEIMVHFGLTLKEHQSLLQQQEELRVEMNVATKIQDMILRTKIPKLEQVDVGMVSIPIRKMNGDYVHFLSDDNLNVSVAVTDVVGKGVPAALCMSMVKYGLDTLEYATNDPSYILEVLNRIIEKSVDDSMFVSMFYGTYNVEESKFTYGSAGHEPAIYYNAREQTFCDLESKGLLLGVMPEVKYPQYEIRLGENDFIIMITDGVTDFRKQGELDPRDVIKSLALSYSHLSAQEMCEKMYAYLKALPDFDLEDDFTVVIFKK